MTHEHKTTQIRQKEIVLAARRLIIKKGAEHLTVRKIADEVGISEAAVYRHFKTKKDILSLLLESIEQNLFAEVAEEKTNGHTTMETIDRILRRHLSGLEQRRGIRFQVIAEIISLGDKGLNRRAYETVDKYIDCIRGLLNDGVLAGSIQKEVNVDGTATLLFSVVQGTISIWALGNYSFDPMTLYEPMWQIVRQAIQVAGDQNIS